MNRFECFCFILSVCLSCILNGESCEHFFSNDSDREKDSFCLSMMPELKNVRVGFRKLAPSSGKMRREKVFLKQITGREKLRYLDLTLCDEVILDDSLFPVLEELKLGDKIQGLERLNMPRLKRLTLSLRNWPPVKREAPLKLSDRLGALEDVDISATEADFDFSSLARRKLKTFCLSGYNGKSIDFLRGQPLQALKLRYCSHVENLSVLAGMPLKKLDIDPSIRPSDYSFLRHLALEELRMAVVHEKFDPLLLKKMPLKKLLLMNHSGYMNGDWSVLEGKPLRELALVNFLVSEESFAVFGTPSLESLALQQVYISDPRKLFLEISKNKNLRNFYCVNLLNKDTHSGPVCWSPPWELLADTGLTSLTAHVTDDIGFLKKFHSLKNLKLVFVRQSGKVSFVPLKNLKLANLFVCDLPEAEAECKAAGVPIRPQQAMSRWFKIW